MVELHVFNYQLVKAHVVETMLQLYVSQVLQVDADTNIWLDDTMQHDLSQLNVLTHEIVYQNYQAEANVQELPNVRLNHIRLCLLGDYVQTPALPNY